MSYQPFSGKVILVTGAARGIGLAVATYLAARGATLAVSDIDIKALQTATSNLTKSHPGSTIHPTEVDISKTDDVARWVASSKKEFGRIDGCVNNAGIAQQLPLPIADSSLEDWDRVLATNLTGTFNCLRAELKEISDAGSIVNVSSVSGIHGAPGLGAYTASKHGIIGLTKVAAAEIAARGVRVNAVCPGFTDTDIVKRFNELTGGAFAPENLPQLFKRYADPAEIAALIGFLLGDESKFVTAATYSIDAGFRAA